MEKMNKKSWIMKGLENERFVNHANYILSIVTTFLGGAIMASFVAGQLSPMVIPLAILFMMAFMLKLFEMYVKANIKVIEAKVDNAMLDDTTKANFNKMVNGFKSIAQLLSNLVVQSAEQTKAVGVLLTRLNIEVQEYERTEPITERAGMVRENGATVDDGQPTSESVRPPHFG